MPSPAAADDALTLVLTRVIDAPRETVFKAFIDPAQIARWMGPAGITAEVTQLEPRAAGAYRIVMHGTPNGFHAVRGVYRTFEPPQRLVFTWAWDQDMETHRAGHESLVTVSLRDLGGKTEVTLRHEKFESTDSRDSHGQGWGGSLDKLAQLLSKK
jgi:uncharacterized protein YndB with AHSA1/START domain